MNFSFRPPRYYNNICKFGGVCLLLLVQCWTAALAQGDDIRWFDLSIPEYDQNRFRIGGTHSIHAFASAGVAEEGNYDVTMIDDRGRIVRLDTATGKHWEIRPYSFETRKPDTHQPYFELIDDQKRGQYLGHLLYPKGGDPILQTFDGRPATFRTVAPYPVPGGFRGILGGAKDGRDGRRSVLYTFHSDPRLSKLRPTRISLGKFAEDVPITSRTAKGYRLFESDPRVTPPIPPQIVCWRFDGESFALPGEYRIMHDDWDMLAAFPVPNSKAILIVFEEGLMHYDGQRCSAPFLGGWSPSDRGKWLQIPNGESRFSILMRGPEGQWELWDWGINPATRKPEVIQRLPLKFAEFYPSFEERGGILAVQTTHKRGDLYLFERPTESDPPKLIGRTSALTEAVGRAESWTVSDDGKTIFFVSRSKSHSGALKLGKISVGSLRFQTTKSAPAIASGFESFSQDDMSFEELPTDATAAVVGILPEADRWLKISPNDRWLVGNGGESVSDYDLHLYDTHSRESHFLPGLGGDSAHAFSADSRFLSIFENGRVVQVWDVSGIKPFFLASNDRLPKAVRKGMRPFILDAKYGACFVSSDSVATTNRDGSVRFRIEGPDLKVVYQSDELKSPYAVFSNDGSSLAIFKAEGDIWRYEWTGETWKVVAKFKVPFFSSRHGRSNLRAMSPEADQLVIYGYKALTVWNELQNRDKEPLTTAGQKTNALGFSTLMDLAVVSQNRQWIAYLRNHEYGSDLTLVDPNLKTVATQALPFSFDSYNRGFLVANDGKHVLIRDKSAHTYVIRLQAK